MIDSIVSITNMGRFRDFKWRIETEPFSQVNLVLGYNGSGKTTLSNVLRLFSDKEQDGGESLLLNLSSAGNDGSATLKVGGKRLPFNSKGDKLPIYVFNADFTADHVFQGSTFHFKPFDKNVVTAEQLKNPKIAQLESRIEAVQKERTSKTEVKTRIEKAFQEIKDVLSKEYNTHIKGSRMPSITLSLDGAAFNATAVRKQLDKAYSDFDLCDKQGQLEGDLKDLVDISFKPLATDVAAVNDSLSAQIKEKAKANVEGRIALWHDCTLGHATVVEWFEDGARLLRYSDMKSGTICPLCGSDIGSALSSLISDYDSYFNQQYKDLEENLRVAVACVKEDQLTTVTNSSNFKRLRAIANRYSISTDPLNEGLLDVTSALKLLQDMAQNKMQNMLDLSKHAPHEVISALLEYNVKVERARKTLESTVITVEHAKIDPKIAVSKIKTLVPQLCIARTNEWSEGHQLKALAEAEKAIKEADDELATLTAQRASELSTLRKESKYINSFLHRMGILHFEISLTDTVDTDSIQVRFASGQVKSGLKHSLSEGEKTALAFAYFLSKLKYEVSDNPKVDKSTVIVVVDDPVSSLTRNDCT